MKPDPQWTHCLDKFADYKARLGECEGSDDDTASAQLRGDFLAFLQTMDDAAKALDRVDEMKALLETIKTDPD
jgi:hypothetical protein